MKKILVLSQFFYPDKTGTGKILAELFFNIDKNFFNIDVVSSCQMYSDKENKILVEYERFENLKIYRVFKNFVSKEKATGRLFNYVMFFLLAVAKVYTKALAKDKDIIVSVSNPPIMPLFAAYLKNKKNKVIYILHDLYPDIAIGMNVIKKDSLLSRVMYKSNKYIFSRIDYVVVLGRDMKNYLMKEYQVPEEKISIITNWSELLYNENSNSKLKKKFRILYSGNIGRFHNLDLAVKVVSKMKEVELVFIGEGAQKEYLINLSKSYSNISFLPYLDEVEYRKVLNSADALLVSLEKNLSGLAVPSKFYTYLSVGKPIICISDIYTEMALIIDENQCGIVVQHEDLDSFSTKLNQLINDDNMVVNMGKNALDVFKKKYSQNIVIKKYEKLFKNI